MACDPTPSLRSTRLNPGLRTVPPLWGDGGADVSAYQLNVLASDWIRLRKPLRYATNRQHFIGKNASLRMHCDGIAELRATLELAKGAESPL